MNIAEPFSSYPLNDRVIEHLGEAQEFARFSDFEQTHGAHMALALLGSKQNILDALLRDSFAGLQASTILESLLDILETEGHQVNEPEARPKGPDKLLPPLSTSGTAVLDHAAQLAIGWGKESVTVEALACAVFEQPDSFVVEAFGDAGLTTGDLEKFAGRLADLGKKGALQNSLPSVFHEDQLNFDVFGPVTRDALHMLVSMAETSPEQNLRDIDLLFCLLCQPDSLAVEALHVHGHRVSSIRSHLETLVSAPARINRNAELSTARMSRLLRRVFEMAAELAAEEHCSLVSESQLLRAHLVRIAGTTHNLYEKLRINTVSLRTYLAQHTADRVEVEVQKQDGMIDDIAGYLRARVVNQDQAIDRVVPSLLRMRSGLGEPGRLMGVFLFLGATGVGKTELARAIADVAFGAKSGLRDPYLIRIDCGNFTEPRDIVQLLGAPQGLVGYKEGQLTNGLREKPRAVILFDEAEKANHHIWQSLLPLFDEGLVREADGTEYDATGCILIATSNKGYKEAVQEFDLWQADKEKLMAMQQQIEMFLRRHIKTYFSPEFMGRIGIENMIFFNHFDKQDYQAIVQMQVDRMGQEMEERGIKVVVDDDPSVVAFLAEMAWKRREEGARPVRRLVTQHLRDQMVAARVANPDQNRFCFTLSNGQVQLKD